MHLSDISALWGDQKAATKRDTGHAFWGAFLEQRGGTPGHGCKKAANAARAQVSFLSHFLFQQACRSCSLPARVQEHLLHLPCVPPVSCCLHVGQGVAELYCPSSHLEPKLGLSHVCNFYCSWCKCCVCGISCVPGWFLVFSFLTFFTLEYLRVTEIRHPRDRSPSRAGSLPPGHLPTCCPVQFQVSQMLVFPSLPGRQFHSSGSPSH